MTNSERRGVFIEVLKLSPVVLLGILMVGMKLDFLVAAPIATIYVAIIAWLTEKFTFNKIVEKAVDSVKEIQLVFFILMLAYAMAEAFMATGVGASIIIMALNFGLTAKTIAVTGNNSNKCSFSNYRNFLGNFRSLCSNIFMAKSYC